MPPLAEQTTILIVSDDVTAAALLGGLVETLDYGVVFASVAQTAEAIRRSRPQACLLDYGGDARDEAMIARIMMRGLPVVLVGPRDLAGEMREVAGRHGAEMILMPPGPGPLGDVLDRAVRRFAG